MVARLSPDLDLRLVVTSQDVWECLEWFRNTEHEILGLDTETSGLNPYAPDARIRLIQVGDHMSGWAIPVHLWAGLALEILNEWQGQWVLHNVVFDATWLKIHLGWEIPWHRTHDTMIMAQIEDPDKPAALKVLTTLYVDPMASIGEKLLKQAFKDNGWGWNTVPYDLPVYWFYSALDPVLAVHLWSHYRTDLKYPESYDLEMSVLRVCANMSHKGMRVDLDYSQRKFDELKNKVTQSKDWAQENWGFAVGSNPQLAAFYKDTLGAKFSKFSAKTNAPSVDKEQMELFSHSDNENVREVTKFILEMRKADKMSNSYFKNFLEMHDDEIVHPQIKTNGARTGRMSVTSPALQTIPKGDALVRGAFIRRNEGDILISCDYSQVEMRLLAHFSGDAKLQAAFHEADATGGDFFVSIGRQVYNDPNFSKADKRRGLMKGVMYGAAYGSGIQKMADTAGVSFEEMKKVSDDIFTAYPGIKSFMAETEKLGELREKEEGVGYVVTSTGRRLPADKGKMYTLTNYTLQGTAAELMKKAIVRLDAGGFADYMLLPIHDEMIFSIPADMVDEAMPKIQELMSYCDGEFAVDLPAEPEIIGYSWGEKYAA